LIDGLTIHGKDFYLSPTARIKCDRLTIGSGSHIGDNCVIEGAEVVIGRDAWLDEGARIGGGSCHDPSAFLHAGDFLHMGKGSEINIARGVTIGDECGIGIETKIFTHGAYLSEWEGFPVDFAPVCIGNRVWLPNAWVNPGVTIGDDVVIAARSLVNADLPSGCLAAGIPARVVREHCYPRVLAVSERLEILKRLCAEINAIAGSDCALIGGPVGIIDVGGTLFDVDTRTISGRVTSETELARNQLRRRGIRFRYAPVGDSEYAPW
jgi:acetyltransferase-like isoleucine patch superfamily enzyme